MGERVRKSSTKNCKKSIAIGVGIAALVGFVIVVFTNIDELVFSGAPNFSTKMPMDFSTPKKFDDVVEIQKEILFLGEKNLELRSQEARIGDQWIPYCVGKWDENICPAIQKKHQEKLMEIDQLQKRFSELMKQRDEYLAEHPDEIMDLQMEFYP
ncbi:MAG: hypothetical protein NPMRTH1_1550012 [Nitrosopumilales archaeon]|nr:MAG: hypothetical protein NPMRTH1_1550012 [Nitrosopumilales archaeon]